MKTGGGVAFLLVDVVLAIGLLAGVVLGWLAWIVASGRALETMAETAVAIRLGEEIRWVLEERGWRGLGDDLPNESRVLRWGADREGRRMGAETSWLDAGPGEMRREPGPFFLIELRRAGEPLGWTPSLRPVLIRVSWPHGREVAGALPRTWTEVPWPERRVRFVHLALAR